MGCWVRGLAAGGVQGATSTWRRAMKVRPVRSTRASLGAVLFTILPLAVVTAATFGSATAVAAVDCGAPRTLSSNADAWIDQSSASTNKGTDSILKVQSLSLIHISEPTRRTPI